ncbi:hypothetical protein CSW58_07160 [Caulobacter sp. B11]|nr:hypothetical protein CSW58_07160 [Caulobacter sp. B11]
MAMTSSLRMKVAMGSARSNIGDLLDHSLADSGVSGLDRRQATGAWLLSVKLIEGVEIDERVGLDHPPVRDRLAAAAARPRKDERPWAR